jgi:hypothetical protein
VAFAGFWIMMRPFGWVLGGEIMRAFLLACVIAAVLAITGYYGLRSIQEPVSEAFSTSAVRLNS